MGRERRAVELRPADDGSNSGGRAGLELDGAGSKIGHSAVADVRLEGIDEVVEDHVN
jgi:hypothetical protein